MSDEQPALLRCKHDYGPPEMCPFCKAESEPSPGLQKSNSDGDRVCPHCRGSLARYEDPVAVEIIHNLESELRRESMRVDWLLARQYNHNTRKSVDAEIFACGDCDPCLGGRPDQCAVMSKPPIV